MSHLDLEVLLAAIYAGFLLVVAWSLELAARHSHRRSEGMRLAGFRYNAEADLWTCPNDEKLLRAHVDYSRGVVFYRAAAHACNNCPIKSRCTDSTDGRLIEHRPDSWLDSELRRFHRAVSLTLAVLAALLLTIEFVRYTSMRDRVLTGGMLLWVSVYAARLASTVTGPSSGDRIPRA